MDKLADRQRPNKEDFNLRLIFANKAILPVLFDKPQVQRGGLQHPTIRIDIIRMVPDPHQRLDPQERGDSRLGHGHKDNIVAHRAGAGIQIAQLSRGDAE